jgi:hypothetical protein
MSKHTEITRATGRPIDGTYRMNDRSCTRRSRDTAGIHSPNSAGENLRPPKGLALEPGNPMRHNRNEYGMTDDAPLDEGGNINTDDEGLCQCSYCKERRAKVADEATESSSTEISSPSAVNDKNRARFGQDKIRR